MLATRFNEQFKVYEEKVAPEVRAASPRVA
jgi:hypothetical protein